MRGAPESGSVGLPMGHFPGDMGVLWGYGIAMPWLQDGPDVALDVERWSLDELAAQIGRAISRLHAALGDPTTDEWQVRAWLARLAPATRASVLATVLADTWPDGGEAIVAAIRNDRRAPSPCA